MLFRPVKQFVRTACESYVNQYYFIMSIDKLKIKYIYIFFAVEHIIKVKDVINRLYVCLYKS